MMRVLFWPAVISCQCLLAGAVFAADTPVVGVEKRIPWTSSRLIGSPEGPAPFTVEKFLPALTWKAPIYIAAEPHSDRLWVVEQGGEKDRPAKIVRIRNQAEAPGPQVLLEMTNRLIYGLTFHPQFETNGFVFVFSNGPWGQENRTNRVSRFRVGRETSLFEPNSERIILEWKSAGHDGGDLGFGNDRMLYIASGDGTSDSDRWVSGQDISNLLGAILRIDVDGAGEDQTYRVPPDNPFVGMKNARPEIWAYGLRNPWRLTVDRKTGHIWVGNNGQDLWETAHLIRRGENYGWSVYEGSHPFYLNRARGPTPIVKPTIEHHHSEFRSLTGGVVYYGEPFPELNGVYVYGDYSTGKIWGARHDGERLVWHQELADTSLQIAAFTLDHQSNLLIADLAGGLYRLVRTAPETDRAPFPVRLSETGLFTSTVHHEVAPGVVPYSVNAAAWADGATVERFIAVPGELKIHYKNSRGWDFPDSSVLVQTLSLATGRSKEPRRIETRVLLRQQGEWTGYSYLWNDEQTDAELVPAKGKDLELAAPARTGADAVEKQVWRIPSRAECMVCHSRAANYVLGMTELQMNRETEYGSVRANQLRTLEHIGFFSGKLSTNEMSRLVDPYDSAADLEARARSYLHVNCSVCHVEAGGGNAMMELEFATPRAKMNLINARPQHDTFGMADAMLVAPGDPSRSVLLQRISRRGPGQMPPLVTTVIDQKAVGLFRDWIAQMKPERAFVQDWTMDDLVPRLGELGSDRSLEAGELAFRETGCIQCHRIAGEGGSVGPDLSDLGQRMKAVEILESIVLPSKVIAEAYAAWEVETIDGTVFTGRIESEDAMEIRMRAHSAVAEATVIRKSNVVSKTLSKVSNMPGGTLNTLRAEQILDLLAYLSSSESNRGEGK